MDKAGLQKQLEPTDYQRIIINTGTGQLICFQLA